MRASVDKYDPGYNKDANAGLLFPFFNGEPLMECITADEEIGEAEVYTGFVKNNEIETEILKGDVKIYTKSNIPFHLYQQFYNAVSVHNLSSRFRFV